MSLTTPIRNMPIDASRCRGADEKFRPTICPQREQCQRHRQLELDRQFNFPPELKALMKVMVYPRVGDHSCHYFLELQ